MTLHRATRGHSIPVNPAVGVQPRQPAGPVVLFIAAVLVAGLTCVLYLWQQSQIVANQQDIRQLDSQYTTMLTQVNDLQYQANMLGSVSRIVAEASKYGMVPGDSRQFKQLTVQDPSSGPLVAQNEVPSTSPVVLPATNAAITSWWQDAWDGLFNLVQ
jgi:uncharacterized protein HemX